MLDSDQIRITAPDQNNGLRCNNWCNAHKMSPQECGWSLIDGIYEVF